MGPGLRGVDRYARYFFLLHVAFEFWLPLHSAADDGAAHAALESSRSPLSLLCSRSLAAWLRHAEIKHGRIAMAGFVGFMAAANYETVGAPMAKTMYAPIASGLSAPEVWDAIPFLAKLQIIGAIGCLEHISEDKNLCALPPPPSNTHTINMHSLAINRQKR